MEIKLVTTEDTVDMKEDNNKNDKMEIDEMCILYKKEGTFTWTCDTCKNKIFEKCAIRGVSILSEGSEPVAQLCNECMATQDMNIEEDEEERQEKNKNRDPKIKNDEKKSTKLSQHIVNKIEELLMKEHPVEKKKEGNIQMYSLYCIL